MKAKQEMSAAALAKIANRLVVMMADMVNAYGELAAENIDLRRQNAEFKALLEQAGQLGLRKK